MAKRLTGKRCFVFALAPVAAGVALALSLLLPTPQAAAARREQGAQNRPKVADDEAPPKERNNNAPPTNSQRPPRLKLYDVTFVTSMPDVEVFLKTGGLGTRSLGKSKADGLVKAQLAAGRHQILASRQGHEILSTTIQVQPRANQFDLAITAVASAPKKEEPPVVVPPVVVEPQPPVKTPEEEAAENAARAAQIIANFLDPKRVEEVPTSDWEFVLAQTGAALARDPANTALQAQALLAQGQLAYLKADYPNSLVYFNKAVLVEPKLLPALYGLGNAYLKSGQYADAFRAYNRAAAADANFAPAFRGMRDALIRQYKLKEAKQYDERFRSLGGASTPEDRLNAAVGLMKEKRWPDALRELEEVAKTRETADVHVLIGDCHVGMKKPLSAADSYRRATTLNPSSALAHFKLGETMYEYREYAAAFEALEKSLALDSPGTVINRARARKMADEAFKKMKTPK